MTGARAFAWERMHVVQTPLRFALFHVAAWLARATAPVTDKVGFDEFGNLVAHRQGRPSGNATPGACRPYGLRGTRGPGIIGVKAYHVHRGRERQGGIDRRYGCRRGHPGRLAVHLGLPYQSEVEQFGATEGRELQLVAPTGGSGIPCPYSHAPVELMDLRDMEIALALLEHLVRAFF